MTTRRHRVRAALSVQAARFPVIEFDPSREAILEASREVEARRIFPRHRIPLHCVMCFFREVLADVIAGSPPIHVNESEIGERPIHLVRYRGKRLVVAHPGVGAPLAAATLEGLIALGCRKFITCGGAGVLKSSINVGQVVVPTSAVRDEGTSYQYLRPSREVAPTRRALAAIRRTLAENGVDSVLGKTWTTDAVYRETRARMLKRRAEGCITVEMEASALFAVARFRRVELAQMLYGGDDLSDKDWDAREWSRHASRRRLFDLAAEACLNI